MLQELFAKTTVYGMLRDGLDVATAAQRRIAGAVAGLRTPLAGDGFGTALDQQLRTAAAEADVQRAMVDLADTQLKFDATARLLQRSYALLRTAIRDRG